MNEETLYALTQLLALVTLQDDVVTEAERKYVINLFRQDMDPVSLNKYINIFDRLSGYESQKEIIEDSSDHGAVTMKETVRTLAICNKINKTLELKQKVLLLLKILQLIAVDGNFSAHKKRIIETISAVFSISETELKIIEEFVFYRPGNIIHYEEILIINNLETIPENAKNKHIQTEINGEIIFLKLDSVDMYFVKYYGNEEIILNGFIMSPVHVYTFSNGSSIKTPFGNAIYYSDLVRNYLEEIATTKISFRAIKVEYKFPSGDTGLRNISISEGPGKLIGIMGVSGAGKTTLLNVMAGIIKPSKGVVRINGINIHSHEGRKKLKGVIGYISQDDLLIEELTVYENLYYNARLCFGGFKESRIREKVDEILKNLGLWERKDMKVGSVLNKTLSGGQRKRLNIALELIREPTVLFVDEPTSGLSSRDSENVMDLLKELTYRGKLVFVVIHQPSSDIYKLFDRIFILDVGGYPIYYGNPVEAVIHFKKATRQVDSERGICPACGNVNPEQIFNIVEEKVVDEYGSLTDKRKVQPKQWSEIFLNNGELPESREIKTEPEQKLVIPSRLTQLWIFIKRDLKAKLSDNQYLLLNLLEAPALALILAGIVRYKNAFDNTVYLFRFNDNIPIFLMMSIIVALFLGLMVSAEEIIRDRKILKRESFLNLSRNSYLLSKLFILFLLSAIQTFTFVITGNLILEIKGMTFAFWLILFTVSCFGNVLGLNISDGFKSSVTVYIMIPLLIIPQMILSGLLVSFDKINEIIGNKAQVPVIADLMTTRWAYEAMAVHQFVNNEYERPFYQFEKHESQANYKSTFYTEKLKEMLDEVVFLKKSLEKNEQNDENITQWKTNRIKTNLKVLRNELLQDPLSRILPEQIGNKLDPASFQLGMEDEFYRYINDLKSLYRKKANDAAAKRERLIHIFTNDPEHKRPLDEIKNNYYNESLADLVRNNSAVDKIAIYRGSLYQLVDPIYNTDLKPRHILDYRAHFFVPKKYFLGAYINTFVFNTAVIWLLSFLLYLALYFRLLKKLVWFFHSEKNE